MIKTEDSRALATAVVKSVKEALEDYDREEIQYALSSIDKFVLTTKGQVNYPYFKSRKALLPLRNTLSGALDAETNRSLSTVMDKYEPKIHDYLENFVTEFKAALKSESVRIPKSDKPVGTMYQQDIAHEDLKRDIVNQKDIDMLEQHIDLLRKLPKSIKEGFEIVETAVLPAFNKLKKLDDALTKAKIKFDTIDIYYILKDQLLIAFNAKAIGSSPDKLSFVRDCVETLNHAGNTQYELVTDYMLRGPGSENIMYAWIMEKRAFNRLYEASGSFSVKQWSFPTVKEKNGVKPQVRPQVKPEPRGRPVIVPQSSKPLTVGK